MRFMKFLKVKANYDYLHLSGTDELKKRKTLYNLHETATEVHKSSSVDKLMDLFENDSEVTMRQTRIPSLLSLCRSSRMFLNSSELPQAIVRKASYQDLKRSR